jgi:hypothetical protein
MSKAKKEAYIVDAQQVALKPLLIGALEAEGVALEEDTF